MKPYALYTLLILGFSIPLFSQAQQQKGLIQRNFDSLVFYPDSTIQYAYRLKRGKLHGFAVEYDSLGKTKYIGQYKRGKKYGRWEHYRGYYAYHDRREKKDDLMFLNHGFYSYYYHHKIRLKNFKELYESLLGFAPNDLDVIRKVLFLY